MWSIRLNLAILVAAVQIAAVTSSVPNVDAILSSEFDGTNSLVANKEITKGYAWFARKWMQIVDPNGESGKWKNTKVLAPWYAFGVHASNEICIALESLAVLKEAFPSENGVDISTLLSSTSNPAVQKLAAAAPAGIFYDVRVASTSLGRINSLSSGKSFTETLGQFKRTASLMFEHGNRLIFDHIGRITADYFTWRDGVLGDKKTVSKVIFDSEKGFKSTLPPRKVRGMVPNSETDPLKAKKAFDQLSTYAGKARCRTQGTGLQFPERLKITQLTELRGIFSKYSCTNLISAAFGLYEVAAEITEANLRKNALIQAGNLALTWCEQAEAVTPAFRPHNDGSCAESDQKPCAPTESEDEGKALTALPHELPRDKVMQVMTSFFVLRVNGGLKWSLYNFCKKERAKGCPTMPHFPASFQSQGYKEVSEPGAVSNLYSSSQFFKRMNWGDTNTRYLAITLGAFEKTLSDAAYPAALFPIPEPFCKGKKQLTKSVLDR